MDPAAPLPPAPATPPPPKKPNTALIVVAVLVIACCFCFGLVGLLFGFGEPILTVLGVN